MNAAIARGVGHVIVVAEIASGKAPGSKRIALAVEAGLRAERGVFVELLSAVVGVKQELKVVVPYEAAGSICGLEREAGAVAKADANFPAGLLLEGSVAGRRDDLSVDGGAGVCDIACCAAGRGGPQRDRGTDGECRAAGQGRGRVFGGYDIGLHRVLSGVGRIAGGHHTLFPKNSELVTSLVLFQEGKWISEERWDILSHYYRDRIKEKILLREAGPTS
ncbi:hypothetical protein BH09PAT4_BH09PAT4_09550 [soil metagenome]